MSISRNLKPGWCFTGSAARAEIRLPVALRRVVEPKGESEGFLRRDDWLISFRPGGREEIEEITDEQRWKQRIQRDRPLHDLDFCMMLRAVHETLAHGRALTAYEHYALKFLDAWRHLLTPMK